MVVTLDCVTQDYLSPQSPSRKRRLVANICMRFRLKWLRPAFSTLS